MARLDKAAEDRLLDGLVRVGRLVADGQSPSAAIAKVASEARLPIGHARLMVNAYNTGRTNRQRGDHDNPFDKSAEFELADAARVVELMFPPVVKSAAALDRETGVSEEYAAEPAWPTRGPLAPLDYDDVEDVPLPRDPGRFYKEAEGATRLLSRERDRLFAEADDAYDKVAAAFGGLAEYFKTLDAQDFDDVRENALAFYGEPAAVLLDKAAECVSAHTASKPVRLVRPRKPRKPDAAPVMTVKRAGVLPPMDRRQSPYSDIERCLAAVRVYNEAVATAAAFEKEAVDAELRLHWALAGGAAPLAAQVDLSILRRARGEKRAFAPGAGMLGAGVGFALGNEAGNSIMKKLLPPSDDKLKRDAFTDVVDPSHEARLRAIRAQATLHAILNSPYFEGEDPAHVTDLYNQVAKLSPRIGDQPIVLEAAMRRLMSQGQADPHDLDQLLGIETKLKQRDQMPTGSSDAASVAAPSLVGPPRDKE